MIKRLTALEKIRVLLFGLLLCLASAEVFAQSASPFSLNESPLPAPTGFVNDFVGVLDAGTKQQLEARIKELKEKTNPQVELAVAIVGTTGERPIFDYSLAVARGWKIGSKEDDNPSALLFIAIEDRKYFTHVSKDLEDELPDGLVGQLQRQNLVPAFKQQNYAKGISDTIEAYISTIEAKQSGVAPAAEPTPQQRGRRSSGSSCNFMTCLIILFVLLII
ncbi:MAG: TPM domain-containing protein, partial [Acidobacteria bacterium]|nr:TPM domain-containing protein [Acidobacteriota bacterium]